MLLWRRHKDDHEQRQRKYHVIGPDAARIVEVIDEEKGITNNGTYKNATPHFTSVP